VGVVGSHPLVAVKVAAVTTMEDEVVPVCEPRDPDRAGRTGDPSTRGWPDESGLWRLVTV